MKNTYESINYLDIGPDISTCFVNIDKMEAKAAIKELLVNAVIDKHTNQVWLKLGLIDGGSKVQLTIEDDGDKIDLEEVVVKAIENNIICAEEVDNLTKDQVFDLLFRHRFSVRGCRSSGVGLSIVYEVFVEMLGGKAVITNRRGKGVMVKITFKNPISSSPVQRKRGRAVLRKLVALKSRIGTLVYNKKGDGQFGKSRPIPYETFDRIYTIIYVVLFVALNISVYCMPSVPMFQKIAFTILCGTGFKPIKEFVKAVLEVFGKEVEERNHPGIKTRMVGVLQILKTFSFSLKEVLACLVYKRLRLLGYYLGMMRRSYWRNIPALVMSMFFWSIPEAKSR